MTDLNPTDPIDPEDQPPICPGCSIGLHDECGQYEGFCHCTHGAPDA